MLHNKPLPKYSDLIKNPLLFLTILWFGQVIPLVWACSGGLGGPERRHSHVCRLQAGWSRESQQGMGEANF